MKKIYKYISILALASFAASCAKEELVDPNENTGAEQETVVAGKELSFTLSVPASAETKTVLGAKDGSTYPVYWSEGDVVALNGIAATEFIPSSDGTSATAKFKLASLAAPYNFLYGGVSGTSDQVSFPATQNYVADSFDPAAMPMYASLANVNENVTFSHVGALLRFSFTGTDKISSVTLTAADESKSLSGNFTIGTSSGVLDGTLTPVAGSASLLYSFGEDKQLSQTPFVFYVAVPAGTYPGGIVLEVVDNAAGHMTMKVMADAETIEAGKVREFSNVVYAPEKELNLILINSDATLQQFATRVAGGEPYLNARVTADFTATSAWTPVADYKGIFDGNSKTISGLANPLFDNLGGVVKNLTLNSTITATDDSNWGIFTKTLVPSAEVDDVAGLYNCTAKGSLTFTPAEALSADSQIGGLVGNNRGGVISNCTNEAAVTMGDNGQSNASQVSLGGVVGRTQKGGDLSTQGEISNCTNNGSVVCNAQLSENIYIGGVLGFQVETKEYISGCVNNGLVKLGSTFSTSKSIQLGGVIGMGKGTIESCSNSSSAEVTTEAGSTGGNASDYYIGVGGVVGRISREDGTYSGLTNAGTINFNTTGEAAWIGGIVGRFNEGATLSSVTNSGSINCSAETDMESYIGGIAPRITKSITDCHSTGGTITYTGANYAGKLYIGGVTGYTNAAVQISNCSSAMTLNIGGAFEATSNNYFGFGGVIGNVAHNDATLIDCSNTGDINWSQEISANGYSFIGGVAGRSQGVISGCSNSGTVTYSGKNSAQNPFVGGIVGTNSDVSGDRILNCTNSGNIVINTSTQSNKYIYVGGIAGRTYGTVIATNSGDIDVLKIKCTRFNVGGIAGQNNGTVASGSKNAAESVITLSGVTTSEHTYCGGIVGLSSKGAITGAENAGTITMTDGCVSTKSYFVGGIAGRAEATTTTYCTNSGAVSTASKTTSSGTYIQVAGIIGYNNSTAPISDCTNSGNISNTGNSAGYVCVGGITSESDTDLSNCINTGNISNSGTSSNNYPVCVGGVAGINGGKNFTSCSSSTGTITNSSNCTGVRVGGVVGYVYGSSAVSVDKCTNASEINISNEGVFAFGEFIEHIIAGGIVGRGNAQIAYNECQNDGTLYLELYGAENQAGVRIGGIFGDNTNTTSSGTTAYDNNCTKCVNNADLEIFLRYTAASIKVDNPVAGGIAGRIDKSTESGQTGSILSECTNNGYIHVQSNRGVVAGIAGQMLDGQILNCSNTGYIHYRYNKSTAHYGAVGGIVANAWSSAEKIDGCTNSGQIELRSLTNSSTLSNYAGGILGWAEEDNIVVSNCENTGSVTCSTCTDNKNGAAMAGGIIGYKESSTKDYNNINRGNVTALAVKNRHSAAGGVVGALRLGTIEACYNYGTIEAGEKASAYDKSNATYSVGRAGSIAGFYHRSAQAPYKACEGTITKCYVGGTVQGKHTSGNVVTITADNFGGNIVGWGDDPTDCFFAGN